MGVFVGAWGACVAYCLYCKFRLFPLFDANGGVLPCPEIRLSPARVAGASNLAEPQAGEFGADAVQYSLSVSPCLALAHPSLG